MSCERIEQLLVSHLDDELEPAEAAEVDAHLGGCEACRERLEFLRGSAGWLASALAGPVSEQPVAGPLPRPRRAWGSIAASLLLVAVAGGVWMLAGRQAGDKEGPHSIPMVKRKAPVGAPGVADPSDRLTGKPITVQRSSRRASDETTALQSLSANPGGRKVTRAVRRLRADVEKLQQQRGGQDPIDADERGGGGDNNSNGNDGDGGDDEGREQAQEPRAGAERDEFGDFSSRPGSSSGKGKDGKSTKKTTPKPKTWKRSEKPANTSALMIGDKEKLPLEAMQVAVRVDGFRARVLIDFYFRNPHARQYEGTFKLRLPNGATPYFLAFGQTAWREKGPALVGTAQTAEWGDEPGEIMARRKQAWSAPREARMVEQATAARAYNQTVRRRVDPALMEWSGAGIFSARIFPIAPRKVHRVVIGYDVDLISIGADQELRLDLPRGLPRLAVDLGVTRPDGTEVAVTPKKIPAEIAGRLWYRFDDPEQRAITVRLSGQPAPLLTGADRLTGAYFAARFRPEIPADTGQATAGRGVFMLDTSLSANPERFNVWLKILLAILERNRGTMKQFAVLCFNVETFWYKRGFVANTAANAKALRAWCRELALEGATNLQPALSEAVRPGWLEVKTAPAPHDLFLLSDGAVTWGNARANQLRRILKSGFAGPLFAYRTGLSGTDLRMLTTLTRSSGGALFSMAGEDEVAKVATAHTRRPWRLVRLKLAGARDLLLAGRPRQLYPGQRLLLVGRGTPKAGAPVELRIRRGSEARTLKIKLGEAIRSELTARVYGQVAVGEMESLGRATRATAVPYARHFRVTGRNCSLLMLESEADYRRFGIKPENDAKVVASQPAAHAINQAVDTIGDELGNPKKDFMAFLGRLSRQRPFVRLPRGFGQALGKLAEAEFEVRTRALSCKQRTWKGIPGELTEQLSSRRMTYEAISKEAERRLLSLGPDDALKALTSLIENRPGDLVLARDVCLTAMRWGLGGQAYHTLRRIARSRPWEPLTYHAMAQCLVQQKQIALAMAYYEIGLNGRWDRRYGDVRQILGMEYLNLLGKISRGELETPLAGYARQRVRGLRRWFPLRKADLVITIAWNTDQTDIDLHVVEPTGDRCYYGHRRTRIGGRLTKDVTQGYGPEMYALGKALRGRYSIEAKLYRNNANRASAQTKVYATIYRNWGTPGETIERKVVALKRSGQITRIAQLVVK